MSIKTTYSGYIQNPGILKGASVNSQMKLIIDDYKSRFDNIIVKSAGNFLYYLYIDGKKYYAHILVPSEKTDNVYYDIIIEFTTDKNIVSKNNLDLANVKFFSNDPAFIYTYAYAFKHNDLTIDWLEKKMNKKALTDKPVVRNPNAQTGYIKSLYFAYFFIKMKHLFSIDPMWKNAAKLNKSELLKKIPTSEEVLNNISRQKEILRELKKEKLRKSIVNLKANRDTSLDVRFIKSAKTVKTARMSHMVKQTSLLKRK